ncbi:hypothetical protein EV715DRAFT_250393 [Schizophyllum commune]
MASAMAYTHTNSHPFTRESPPAAVAAARPNVKLRYLADLSHCLFDFVIQLLPTAEEMSVKEDVRKLLERLIRTIEPESRLLSFGSTANGFSLRNSDMDLCCLIDSGERLSASDLVTMLGDLLERETKFHVKPLPHARIPIVKLSLDPSPGLPLGIACDIGFENRLALENTRLLMCYAMIDPTRVRTLVLFLKVWSKRRKINSPYKGTLSSYGYVLLVIFFLVHVKNPAVLPNLQQMPPLRPISKEDTHLGDKNIWFFDDIDVLRQRWHSENTESVAELLIDFFRYYSKDFLYNTGVASIRAGLLKKDAKGWQNDLSPGRVNDARERNRLCIEDPFETDFNVARCVTKDGLYTIRGEFMRASRILQVRPDRAIVAIAELCAERKDEDLVSAPPARPPNVPPQTPYTVGSNLRPKGAPPPDNFSPPPLFAPGPRFVNSAQVSPRPPPEHMAPKRAKWTSPPPPDAPPSDHKLYETSLGKSLELATSSMTARERDEDSSGTSELVEEGERSDAAESDVHSVHSEAGGRRISWQELTASAAQVGMSPNAFIDLHASGRGRPKHHHAKAPTDSLPAPRSAVDPSLSAKEFARRSISGPARPLNKAGQQNHSPPQAHGSPISLTSTLNLPPSPVSPPKDLQHNFRTTMDLSNSATVFYQTTVPRSPVPVIYPVHGSPHLVAPYYAHFAYPTPPHDVLTGSSHDALTRTGLQPSLSHRKAPTDLTWSAKEDGRRHTYGPGPLTPTPASYHQANAQGVGTMTPPPLTTKFSMQGMSGGFAGPSTPPMSGKPPRMHSGGSPNMRSPVLSGLGPHGNRVALSTQPPHQQQHQHSQPHSSPRMQHSSPRMPHKRSFQKRRHSPQIGSSPQMGHHSPQLGAQSPHMAPSPTLSAAAAVPIPSSSRVSPSHGSPMLGSPSPSSMGYAASSSRSPSPVPGPDSPASRSNISLRSGPSSLPRSPVLSPHSSLLPSPPPLSGAPTPPEDALAERVARIDISLPPPKKDSAVVEETAVRSEAQPAAQAGERER